MKTRSDHLTGVQQQEEEEEDLRHDQQPPDQEQQQESRKKRGRVVYETWQQNELRKAYIASGKSLFFF
jgi:hypothetical protein